jgi:NitT/TauT family transport system substrate-binding protein
LKHKFYLTLAALLLVVPSAAAQTGAISFFLTFVPNVQFAPLYVAIDKGYFGDIEVTVQHGDEPDGVNLIAANQLQFGMISGEQVIQARANERPVVFVYEWFQQYPVGVVVPDDSDMQTAADLAGRRVGIPGRFGASYSGLIALLDAAGLQESDLQLEAIGFNAPEVFCIGAVEASVVYVNNEPLQIAQRAAAGDCGSVEAVRVIPVAAAADMVSNGIVTNEITIREQPELVQAIVSGFEAGLRDAINNPAAAYLISANYVENLLDNDLAAALADEAAMQAEFLETDPDMEAIATSRVEMRARLAEQFSADQLVQFDVLLSTIRLWEADVLGLTDPASWEVTQAVLLAMGFLESPTDLSGAYTNQFIGG